MAVKTTGYHIKQIDVSGKEIIFIVGAFLVIGGAIVGYFFIRRGGLMTTSSINVIETTGEQTSPIATISNVSVSDVTSSSATLHWSISSPLPATIQYGIKQDQLSGEIKANSGETSLNLMNLFPRTRYYFRIVAASNLSSPVVSETYSFVTSD